jgi:hypothetical protein
VRNASFLKHGLSMDQKRDPDWHPRMAVCATPGCGRIVDSLIDRPRGTP